MKLSVITVTYNSEHYLEEAVRSVLSQDYEDLEYIIVDGASTDGSREIVRKHAANDRRITWISEPDGGISDAFNKGLRLASGELIGILNSDDLYCPGALRAVAEAMQAYPECDVFHGDMLRLQGDTPLFLLKPSSVEANIWHEMPLNHPATFVTRRGYDKTGGFDVTLKVAMDYDLVLRLYKHGCRFHYLDKTLANMRYGGESDEKSVAALREVVTVTVREGYPPAKAYSWFLYKLAISSIKNVLRKLGLYSLIRMHPRFGKTGNGDWGLGTGKSRKQGPEAGDRERRKTVNGS